LLSLIDTIAQLEYQARPAHQRRSIPTEYFIIVAIDVLRRELYYSHKTHRIGILIRTWRDWFYYMVMIRSAHRAVYRKRLKMINNVGARKHLLVSLCYRPSRELTFLSRLSDSCILTYRIDGGRLSSRSHASESIAYVSALCRYPARNSLRSPVSLAEASTKACSMTVGFLLLAQCRRIRKPARE
jgi:hypothetical protein